MNKFAGAAQLKWERLYEGGEDDTLHSFTMAGDGSMIRLRVTSSATNLKLYVQRVVNPDSQSDYGTWAYTGKYGCHAVTVVSTGSEVSIFFIDNFGELQTIKSTDYGETWGSAVAIDYFPSTDITGFSAAAKPDGDIAVFITVWETLYAKVRQGGTWLAKAGWNETVDSISGLAAVYGNDWDIVVTGKEIAGACKIWSLVYGDGGAVPAGQWSGLKEVCTAASDSDFTFHSVFMDRAEVCRCFYIEEYSGLESYSRPYRSQSVTGTLFAGNQWLEPVPFNFQCDYGMAVSHFGNYCWLSVPSGVWRAEIAEKSIDLSDDVIFLSQETQEDSDSVVIELRNDDGRYSVLPVPLATGCRIDISPGYVTSQGSEYSPGQSYTLESYEYISKGGKCSLVLNVSGGRNRINEWVSGSQFRFNDAEQEMNVIEILEFVLARAGLTLEILSSSAVGTGFYPDFAIYSGSTGSSILKRLLTFIPDKLFIEGDKGYLLYPLATDSSVYSYGQGHSVVEGRYRTASWRLNKVTVEGYDSTGEQKILKDSFAWAELEGQQLRVKKLEDSNIYDIDSAAERGNTYLKTAESESVSGEIFIPVNCGQQLFDLIDITDTRIGFTSEKKRVKKLSLLYYPERGEYVQTLSLCSPD